MEKNGNSKIRVSGLCEGCSDSSAALSPAHEQRALQPRMGTLKHLEATLSAGTVEGFVVKASSYFTSFMGSAHAGGT